MVNYIRYALLATLAVCVMVAAEHHGVVKFGVVPVPGATVTATQGDKKLVAITDQDGIYSFPELADGVWSIQVDMLCFAPVKRDIGVSAAAPVAVAAAGAPAAAAPVEEKTEFDAILTGFGSEKIQVIKVVRAITGLGLKEAKDLVEGVPKPIKEAVPKAEAEDIKKKIEEVGGTVEIK
jgi:large subunit ribosomal protein L7/L12